MVGNFVFSNLRNKNATRKIKVEITHANITKLSFQTLCRLPIYSLFLVPMEITYVNITNPQIQSIFETLCRLSFYLLFSLSFNMQLTGVCLDEWFLL